MKLRSFWVLLHRYTGLAMAAFLIVAGLTGSLLAFYGELDSSFNPQWNVVPVTRASFDPVTFLENVERNDPIIRVDGVSLEGLRQWLG